MNYTVEKVGVWAGLMEDRPGALAEKLDVLKQAGANLDFIIARRAHDQPGSSVMFVAPLKGAKQQAPRGPPAWPEVTAFIRSGSKGRIARA